MLANKTGYPEEGELVQCTVTSVQSHSVFVRIDEYANNGMIHISEIAPGRIRNIRDFVIEGKSVICKVLRVNIERGHIDLSLRRVSESQKRNKITEIKKEKLAEKLVEVVAHNLSEDMTKLHGAIAEKVREHYFLLFECFSDISKGTFDIAELKMPKNVADELKKVILDRLKPEFIVSKGKLKLSSLEPNGVETIKDALKKAVDLGAEVKYLGGGTYDLSATASSYKEAEIMLEKSAKAAIAYIESNRGSGEFAELHAK